MRHVRAPGCARKRLSVSIVRQPVKAQQPSWVMLPAVRTLVCGVRAREGDVDSTDTPVAKRWHDI